MCYGFFCPQFGFGRPGEKRELVSFKNLKKMLFSFSACLSCLLGPVEILSLVLELALFKTRRFVSDFHIKGQQNCQLEHFLCAHAQ